MGLFKDFKDDFSQAVNEMMPGADAPEKENKAEDLVVNTLGEDVDVCLLYTSPSPRDS